VILAKSDGYAAWAETNPTRLSEVRTLRFGAKLYGEFSGTLDAIAREEKRRAELMMDELWRLQASHPECPNVRGSAAPCAVHFLGVHTGTVARARATR
jgi:hypothetical protein